MFTPSTRRSRATTAKKCTKKHDARAKLLFCQSKTFDFLTLSLTSLSSLLKLPNLSFVTLYSSHLAPGGWGPEARFSKVPIINGPGKLSPSTLKIEVSIVLHLT